MAEIDYECTSNSHEDCCVICNLGFEDEDAVSLSHKCIFTLIKFSEIHEQMDLMTYLLQKTVLVHKNAKKTLLI